jgi:hypothetical protein
MFGDSVSCPGLYGGLYGQNLPYKFKKSYGELQSHKFEKSHRTTGPRSDLRPVFVILGKFRSRNDLRQRRNRNFLVDDQGCLSELTVLEYILEYPIAIPTKFSTVLEYVLQYIRIHTCTKFSTVHVLKYLNPG